MKLNTCLLKYFEEEVEVIADDIDIQIPRERTNNRRDDKKQSIHRRCLEWNKKNVGKSLNVGN